MREHAKYVFIWPAFAVVLIVSIFPLFYSLSLSTQSVRMVPPRPPRFVGGDNYLNLLGEAQFWTDVYNTGLIAIASVALQYVIGFALALALFYKVPGERLFRVTFLLPMLMTPVAVALFFRMLFHETFGPFLELFQLFGVQHVPFFSSGSVAIASLILVEIWQWTPFVVLMLLAGLQSLPQDVFEAARLENATRAQMFWTITFPMLLPISAAVVFVRLIESFKIIDTIYVITAGGPGTDTESLTLRAYNLGLKQLDLGRASSLSFLFLAFVIIIGVLYLSILRPQIEKRR